MDVAALQERSGWVVHRLAVTGSTNDVAARLAAEGAPARTVVLADRQTEGRGRAGRRFASPSGGLYASLLLAAHAEDLPGRVVALVAVAAAEAVEAATGFRAEIKWPNDVWLARKKVGGILLESTDPDRPVVAGIGLNLHAVPRGLPPDVAPTVSSLEAVSGLAVERQVVLESLLAAVDRWSTARAEPGGAEALETAWRRRLALIGEDVTCHCAGQPLSGVLEDASLAEGLLIRDAVSGPVWRPAGHVQDLRPAGRTIS